MLIPDPISNAKPYAAECGDIIEALGMDFNEGSAFRAIWDKCASRTYAPDTQAMLAEKALYFVERMLVMEQRKSPD